MCEAPSGTCRYLLDKLKDLGSIPVAGQDKPWWWALLDMTLSEGRWMEKTDKAAEPLGLVGIHVPSLTD